MLCLQLPLCGAAAAWFCSVGGTFCCWVGVITREVDRCNYFWTSRGSSPSSVKIESYIRNMDMSVCQVYLLINKCVFFLWFQILRPYQECRGNLKANYLTLRSYFYLRPYTTPPSFFFFFYEFIQCWKLLVFSSITAEAKLQLRCQNGSQQIWWSGNGAQIQWNLPGLFF